HVVKPNFRALGRRFGSRTQAVAAAIISADPGGLAGQLREAGEASVAVDGEPLVIGPDDVIVTQTPRTGWSVAADAGETVALDLDITPELGRAGVAREMIRPVQEARKADGVQVSDRIAVRWEAADPEIVTALTEHGQLIAGEVLATEFASRALGAGTAEAGTEHIDAGLDLIFWLRPAWDGRGPARGQPVEGRLSGWHALQGTNPAASASRRLMVSRSPSLRKRIRMHPLRWYLGTPGTTATWPSGGAEPSAPPWAARSPSPAAPVSPSSVAPPAAPARALPGSAAPLACAVRPGVSPGPSAAPARPAPLAASRPGEGSAPPAGSARPGAPPAPKASPPWTLAPAP